MSSGSSRLPPVVAVDGPSGVGKGTASLLLARDLGWHLLDSGSLYRLTALAAADSGTSLDDPAAVAAVARALDVEFFEDAGGGIGARLNREDVSGRIRTEDCGRAASRVAVLPEVRAALLRRQRDMRRAPGLVADGRDMGTVVFPDAAAKIFLTASAAVRAERRHKQLRQKGVDASLHALRRDIAERDARDEARAVAPLRPAPDAVVLDTSELSIDEVRRQLLAIVSRAIGP